MTPITELTKSSKVTAKVKQLPCNICDFMIVVYGAHIAQGNYRKVVQDFFFLSLRHESQQLRQPYCVMTCHAAFTASCMRTRSSVNQGLVNRHCTHVARSPVQKGVNHLTEHSSLFITLDRGDGADPQSSEELMDRKVKQIA